MSVAILVPRRADGGRRDELWSWVRDRWERERPDWPIFEGHHDDGPFNRSAAINAAAEAAGDWTVAIIADGDTFAGTSQAEAAVEAADSTGKIVFGYHRYCYLSRAGSDRVMAGYAGSWERFIEWSHLNACSGMVVVARRLWDKVGGFDPKFVGWGEEDIAFSMACQALAGDHLRVSGDVWHLWHPVSESNDPTLPGYQANLARRQRYVEAKESGTMLDLLREREAS